MRVHGLKGKQAELYNDKRGRCVKYFSTGDNSGRYKVHLIGDSSELLHQPYSHYSPPVCISGAARG